jgi:hypothetical protein
MRWLWSAFRRVEPPVGGQEDLAPIEEIPERNARDIVTQLRTCAESLDELRRGVLATVFLHSVSDCCFRFDQGVVTCHYHVVNFPSSASTIEAPVGVKNTA